MGYTLADLQRRPGTPGPATLPLNVERTRTFDTPEFRGMTFLEVEAKTALNRVKGMPFAWSINPYRGCSHACSYCLSGETQILMADGRTKALADVRPGDAVFGTRRLRASRRCVVTPVLDHWSTVKPAYRVRLEDGTELVTSGDHRFLTPDGWKHVAGAVHPGLRGGHLTVGDRLVGTRDAAASEATAVSPAARPRGATLVSPRGVRTGHRCDVQLRAVSIEPLGRDLPLFDITTGTGDFVANGVVSHNCFARPTHAYLNLSPLGDFERTVVVKTNLVEVLRRELRRPTWRGEHVAMGTNTDPYQRCEGRYRLMPEVIAALADALTPFSILTKGTLITRDTTALAAAAERVPVAAALTVGLLDEALWRAAEPGTPSPRARLEAVRALNDAGVPTGVMVAPIMPGLNDDPEQLAALVDAAAAAGAVHITPIVLHLRPGVRELFWPWLEQHHPALLDHYARLYPTSNARKDYRDEIAGFVAARRRESWARHGRPPPPPAWRGGDGGASADPQAGSVRRGAEGMGRADPQAGTGPRTRAARDAARQLRLL